MLSFIRYPIEPCSQTKYYIENEYSSTKGTIFVYPNGIKKQVYSSFLGKNKNYFKYGITKKFIEKNDFVKKSITIIQRFYNKFIKYRKINKKDIILKQNHQIDNLLELLKDYKNTIQQLRSKSNKI